MSKWRYFRCDDPYIRRVMDGECGTMYDRNGFVDASEKSVAFWKMPLFQEITEAEAAAILGGKPWEEKK